MATAAKPSNGHKSHHVAPATAKVSDTISTYRPMKLFRRDDSEEAKEAAIVSLDYDDTGDLLMTADQDDTICLYNLKEGKHNKKLYSKKYGVKHAKFMHSSSSIVYASTKIDNVIRYLSTHDNNYLRYFKGHDAPVTCIAVHPGADNFLSCSEDNTLRLWDANSSNCCAKLFLHNPYLATYDASANVIAVASPSSQTILLYDSRKLDAQPFTSFDTVEYADTVSPGSVSTKWNKLEFSNDGKNILLGTTGHGHYLIDAFTGKLRAYLQRERGGTKRLAAGEQNTHPGLNPGENPLAESSGDCAFTQDGRYVLSGSGHENVLVWDTLVAPDATNKKLKPTYELEFKGSAAVLAVNPRWNFFATADKEVVFWTPDGYGA